MNNSTPHDLDARKVLLGLAGGVAACGLAWWALTWAGAGDLMELRGWPSAISPFGFNSIVVVHVLATAPLAWLLGYFAVGRRPKFRTPAWAAGWAAVGASAMLVTLYFGAGWIPLSGEQFQFAQRLMVRVVWCLFLETPWMMAWWAVADSAWARRLDGISRSVVAYVVLLAVLPPLVFAANLIQKKTAKAELLLSEGQTLRAWRVVDGLVQLNSTRRILSQFPEFFWNVLYNDIVAISQTAQIDLPDDADTPARIERGWQLFALDLLDDAIEALGDAPQTDADAALLASKVFHYQNQWELSTASARRAVDLLDEEDSRLPESLEKRVGAYTTLAESLRMEKRFLDAEGVLIAAIEKLPEQAGRLHYQLGLHYERGGRPVDAIRQLETAIQLSPGVALDARRRIDTIRLATPTCIIGPTRLNDR